jgi:hypothetical protein
MKKIILSLLAIATAVCATAQNPYLPLWEHTPDGEPRVFEDPDRPGHYRLYVIYSHDTLFDFYCGIDTRMWSAPVENLNDWRDEGPIFTFQKDGLWDIMYAPDLVEVVLKDGTKEYWLYPNSRGWRREPMVARASRPDGPYEAVNVAADGDVLPGSMFGFDPGVYVEQTIDRRGRGKEFRAWGFWGFKHSSGAELDPATMYSVKPGTEAIPYFMPSSHAYGVIADPEGTEYPHLFPGEDPKDYNFFEASSIRKVGNKYLLIYSGFSGPDYGMTSSNATLRWAYGDTPLGPWKIGGVLVDARGPVANADGSKLIPGNASNNTHGSIAQVDGQWWVFYHRAPRGFANSRQAMVAPITIQWDEKSVAEGGSVRIRAYDPYKGEWSAKTTSGEEYTGAEVTSEGFNIWGLDPYRYYSAGYASFLSAPEKQTDSWDIWANDMPIVGASGGNIFGYKYFGFGGLASDTAGLKAFEGTAPGNKTTFNLWLTPRTARSFKVAVWLDGPWEGAAWGGKRMGEIVVPEGLGPNGASAPVGDPVHFTLDVSQFVDGLEGKHSVWLVVEGGSPWAPLCDLVGLGFSAVDKPLARPITPEATIWVNDVAVSLPATPERTTTANGITGYDIYNVPVALAPSASVPVVRASATDPSISIDITQPTSVGGTAAVKFNYRGATKTYNLILK